MSRVALWTRGYVTWTLQLPRYLHATKSDFRDDTKLLILPKPQLNIERLCDPSLSDYHVRNIKHRKGVGNINRVMELNNAFKKQRSEILKRELMEEAMLIPNDTHPDVREYGDEPKVIKMMGNVPEYSFSPLSFDDLMEDNRIYRMKELSRFGGQRAYYFIDDLAELENAIIRFTIQKLLLRGFDLISVPDILHHQIIECCGTATKGDRTLVYRLDADKHLASAADGQLCLSGTSELALAGMIMNDHFLAKELPKRLMAVSRCYRAETSRTGAEAGLYRVHQFTKVEMFGVTTSEMSEVLLDEFRSIQEENFSALGLHYRILDMPPPELGAPAYRKYDIEAWLPGRKMFGEISSCSNCTDYQSRRLNVLYSESQASEKSFAHTVNGTACAIPRLVLAICETYQQEDGSIQVPAALQSFMNGKRLISKKGNITNYGRQAQRFFRFWDNTDKKLKTEQSTGKSKKT